MRSILSIILVVVFCASQALSADLFRGTGPSTGTARLFRGNGTTAEEVSLYRGTGSGTELICGPESGGSTVIYGYDTIGASANVSAPGNIVVQKITIGATGVTSGTLKIYSGSASATSILPVILTSAGTKVWNNTNTVVSVSSIGLVSVPFTATLSANTTYWIGYVVNPAANNFTYAYTSSSATSGDVRYGGSAYSGTFPAITSIQVDTLTNSTSYRTMYLEVVQ